MAEVAKVVARLAVGERITTKDLESAYKRGKEQAEGHQRKVSASRAMGPKENSNPAKTTIRYSEALTRTEKVKERSESNQVACYSENTG